MSSDWMKSSYAKLSRAHELADTLQSEIAVWSDSNPYHMIRERDSNATRYSIIVRIDKEPSFERWALLAGDCVHSLRAALDHAVYAIAMYDSQTDPPPGERDLAFPITREGQTLKLDDRRIVSLTLPVREEIERLQPYNRPHPELPPLLAVLRDFDDTDKHRFLQLAYTQAVNAEFENISGLIPNQQMMFLCHKGEIKDGIEIAAIVLDRPTPNLQYEAYRADLTIAIRHAAGPRGHTITGVRAMLRLLEEESRTVVDKLFSVLG